MASVTVTRVLALPAERVWKLVADFGDTSWMPGPPNVEVVGRGPGMERRIVGPEKTIHERLESVDAAARSLVYTIPVNVPFPVTDYRATIRVREQDPGCEIEWGCSFTPEGVPAADAGKAIEGMYGVMIGWIEARARALG